MTPLLVQSQTRNPPTGFQFHQGRFHGIDRLVTADGKPIAKAKTPAIAEDIADRLNEDDCRKEQDRWSA
jgi:hypothetical protein